MKHKYYLFKNSALLLLMMFGTTLMAYAQKAVTGTVTDGSSPLPGVSVLVKGTDTGTSTGADGKFSISVSEGAVLQFTFLGFTTKEVIVGSSNNINVVLAQDAELLNEVVVTGFGMSKDAKSLSYSVQTVDGEDLARASTPNIVNALQGKVAGVMINQGAYGPTGASRIRIRGNSSLSPNTQPLFVVDGVLMRPDVSGAGSWGSSDDFGNVLNNLNAADFESVTVLKGSAASALYGSQAQYGVVIIKTKKGDGGRKGLGVSVSNSTSFETVYKTYDFQNMFGAGINPEFEVNGDGVPMVDDNNTAWSYGPRFEGQQVMDIDGRMVAWQPNDMLSPYETGKYINTNVAVDGGNDRTTFRFSYTNTHNEWVVPNNALNRNNFSLRATQKLSDFLNIDASVNYLTSEGKNPVRQGGNDGNPLYYLSYYSPRNYDISYWSKNYINQEAGGIYDKGDDYGNSGLWWDLYKDDIIHTQNVLRANIDVTAQINPWLSVLLRGNVRRFSNKTDDKQLGTGDGFAGGYYGLSLANGTSTRLQVLLNGNRNLTDDLDLTFGIGGETQRDLGGDNSNTHTNGGLKIPGKYYVTNSVDVITGRAGIGAKSRLDAIYAYGDLTWKNMLTLNFSARNDWNSTLTYPDGHGSYTYFYPSVGLAWSFSELLLDNPAFDFLTYGKLRASLGYTGAAPGPYKTQSGNYILRDDYIGLNGAIPRYGFNGSTLENPNLESQLTREWEFGTDLRFMQNRLGLDFTWYKKNTFNQVLGLGTPSESGVSSMTVNAGDIQNSGLEILLHTVPVRTKNFEWDATFNFTRNWNKIIELAPGVESYQLDIAFGADMQSVAIPGKEYGIIQTGYGFAGYQAVDGAGSPIEDSRNGMKVLKSNGSYYRNQDYEYGEDRKILGSSMEDFLLSTIQRVSYKNFSLGFQLDSKFGGLMASGTHAYASTSGNFAFTLAGRTKELGGLEREIYADDGTVEEVRYDGIAPEGVFADGISITDPNGVAHNVGGMTYAEAVEQNIVEPVSARIYYARLTQWGTGIREFSTFENSWVAVREVSLNYNFPTSITGKLGLNNLSLSLVGRNLGYLYTTTKGGVNPESIYSNKAGAFAERGGVPYIRNIGFRLNASF